MNFLLLAVTVSLHINKPFYRKNRVLCEVRKQQTEPDTVTADYETKMLFFQKTDIGNYSFVNWNQLPAEALGTFPCKPMIFRNWVRKTIIHGVK
jgi:hypothetical protein